MTYQISTKRRATLLAMAAVMLAASPSFAKEWLTASELRQSPDGYSIELGNGQKAQIQRIRAPRGKKTECMVHLPSVQKEALKLAGRTSGIGVSISLQYHEPEYDPNSAAWPSGSCAGAGTGCNIFVVIQ